MALVKEAEQTRERILEAAVSVFSEKGYRVATVRDICSLAGVNVASVNYYFHTKESLYDEALAFSFRLADRKYPQDAVADASLPPEDRLHLFIRTFISRLMDETHPGFHGKLMAREITDPTPAFERIVETAIRPRFVALRDIVPRLGGAGWSQSDIDRFIFGIIGQCLMYRQSHAVIERLSPEIIASEQAIERSAELIYRFSLAALKGLTEARSAIR